MKQSKDQYKPAEKLELKEIKKKFPKVFKKVSCPSCQSEVTAEHLNLTNKIAKCGNCNAIFSIEEDIDSVMAKTEIKQEVFRPEGIDLFYYKDEMDITLQQHVQGLDAFGIAFLPLLSVLSIIVYFAKGILIYFPIVFTIGAVYFIYKILNYSKNKTYITVNNQLLDIKYRPKNLKKDVSYNSGDIHQLYLKHSADGYGYYTIHMIINGLEGQKHVKLITVNTLAKARYLEQEIEQYLNIENKVVPESNVAIKK